jgi:hypothetical protein
VDYAQIGAWACRRRRYRTQRFRGYRLSFSDAVDGSWQATLCPRV